VSEDNGEDLGWEWLPQVKRESNQVAGGLDGHPMNIRGALKPIHEESERLRSTTPVTHRRASGYSSIRESSAGSLRPGCRAVQMRALG